MSAELNFVKDDGKLSRLPAVALAPAVGVAPP